MTRGKFEWELLGQQPTSRVVGRRTAPRPAKTVSFPDAAWREAMTALQTAMGSTHVPKGVFRYRSHEAANRDWDRWLAEAIQQNPRWGRP